MKVLVCGGRNYDDEDRFDSVLDEINRETPITKIVHGGAKGADELAWLWAKHRGVPHKVYNAQWSLHGKAAGPIRNQEMLDVECPDLVVSFPGGKGTADMVRRAKEAGVKVVEVDK